MDMDMMDPHEAAERMDKLRHELDNDLQHWYTNQSDAISRSRAHDIYSKLESITSHLSSQLCEQLRILLEPTVASKLRGDYKTGKRLNIKKIIPYIASQYRKDKIWLRRTQPNKRQYQVMIAIDDSESMISSGASRLALESMTLLAHAMTQLEVGELGILSFGEEVRLLHDFHHTYNQHTGARCVTQFKFNQQITQWVTTLQEINNIMTAAAKQSTHASNNIEHMQLVFVISDARVQQDRDAVSKYVKDSLAKGQFIVLLIIDSIAASAAASTSTTPSNTEKNKRNEPQPQQQSILNTRSVTYPNGKMKITHYLDNFPFPYYIIVRHIDHLPYIISDALRQWIELIQHRG